MTAEQVFDAVIALMFGEEADKSDYESGFLSQLAMRLSECFALNNAFRQKRGKEPLPEPPHVVSREEEIPYEWEVAAHILPTGIAGYLYADDDETGISNVYRERYHMALSQGGPAHWMKEAEE